MSYSQPPRTPPMVYLLGHELAHVEDNDTAGGAISQQTVERIAPVVDEGANRGYLAYSQDQQLVSLQGILDILKIRNENVADERAKGIAESHRACTSKPGCP